MIINLLTCIWQVFVVKLFKTIQNHLNHLQLMEAVIEWPSDKKITEIKVLKSYKYFPFKEINVQYIFPVISVSILFIHTLHVIANHSFRYVVVEMDDLWTHRMIPKVVHFQGDVVINMALGFEIFVYGRLIFDSLLSSKNRLHVIKKDQNFVVITNGKSKFFIY